MTKQTKNSHRADSASHTKSKQASTEIREALGHHLRRHKVRFWGHDYVITPRLVEWIHGDGKQLVAFSPLNTRPNYYVVRIDSSIDLSNWSLENCFADLVLDDLYDAIENEYGRSSHEYVSEKNGRLYSRHYPWPSLDIEAGSVWSGLRISYAQPCR